MSEHLSRCLSFRQGIKRRCPRKASNLRGRDITKMNLITYPQATVELLVSQGFSRTILERFWSKVEFTSTCWIWKGSCGKSGHGHIAWGGPSKVNSAGNRYNKIALASRVSWMVHYGPIPDGLFVLHRCDNGCCVRPEHFFLGTQLDNMRDCKNKGRNAKWDRSGRAKLNWESVKVIRQMRGNGKTLRQISALFEISERHVWGVANLKSWV